MQTTDSVAIVSGGLDSTTLVYDMLNRGLTPHMLSFNYGQRHKKELEFARWHAQRLNLPHDIVDLNGLTNLISNSALTSGTPDRTKPGSMLSNGPRTFSVDVPDGHYAEETMKTTVVPNRNMIMAAIAAGVAVNNKAITIGIGVHAGDHFIYPDCRPQFISLMEQAILTANEGFHSFNSATLRATKTADGFERPERIEAEISLFGKIDEKDEIGTIYAPFLDRTKADIAYRALELGVPLDMTWSCYKGGEYHCGRCGTCVERLEAIHDACSWMYGEDSATIDGTQYEDEEFWRIVVNNAD